VISPTQRPLPDNTQHSQQTDIHAPCGIRTHIPASELPQNYALDRAATGIGNQSVLSFQSHRALSCSPMYIYDLITALFITSNLSITGTPCHMLVTPSYCTRFWVSCLILIGSRNMNDDNKPSAARSATMPTLYDSWRT